MHSKDCSFLEIVTFETGPVNEGEKGFTLIELLVTIAILSILAGLSIASYTLYKENAEYAKGTATMHNARTGIGAAELELPDTFSMAYTQSSTDGSALSGLLAQAMPGVSLPSNLRVGVELSMCNSASDPMDRAAFVVAEPCRATESVRYQKFCGGMEVLLEHVANPAPCS